MMRLIKKWWILRKLHKDCLGHTEQQPTDFLLRGKAMVVARDAFVSWLAGKSLKRFSWILLWRKRDRPRKLNRRIQEYNSAISSLISEKYIDVLIHQNPQFISTTPLGDDFLGYFPLIQELLTRYYLAWTVIVIPLLVGAYGSPYLHSIVEKIFSLAKIKLGL